MDVLVRRIVTRCVSEGGEGRDLDLAYASGCEVWAIPERVFGGFFFMFRLRFFAVSCLFDLTCQGRREYYFRRHLWTVFSGLMVYR